MNRNDLMLTEGQTLSRPTRRGQRVLPSKEEIEKQKLNEKRTREEKKTARATRMNENKTMKVGPKVKAAKTAKTTKRKPRNLMRSIAAKSKYNYKANLTNSQIKIMNEAANQLSRFHLNSTPKRSGTLKRSGTPKRSGDTKAKRDHEAKQQAHSSNYNNLIKMMNNFNL
jgi:hypothetical protein